MKLLKAKANNQKKIILEISKIHYIKSMTPLPELLNGEDMKHTFDYRGVYGTLLEQHLGLDPSEIVLGNFEQLSPFK